MFIDIEKSNINVKIAFKTIISRIKFVIADVKLGNTINFEDIEKNVLKILEEMYVDTKNEESMKIYKDMLSKTVQEYEVIEWEILKRMQ